MSWSLPVASFWAGEPLSFIEQMVIRSYLERGCDFTLYLAHSVEGVPEGTVIRDASDIMEKPDFLADEPSRKGMAVWSDLFRVALLRKRQVIWVDLDAYCVRPFDLADGYGVGLNGEGGALSGVIALPPGSPTLAWMADFLSADQIEPPWADPAWVAKKRKKGKLRPNDLPWGDTGPRLLTHALKECGEFDRALPKPVFYPLFRQPLAKLWTPGIPDDEIELPDTLSVHIFGFTKRLLWTHYQGLPPRGTWLARAAARHGIDPAEAPAIAEKLPGA